MKFIQGWDRQQVHLLPERLEEYIDNDNPARFLDAFVEQLDLRTLRFVFPKEDVRQRGAPSYHPTVLLKLYLYGYLNQVRSSRRLEAECARNVEVMWLMGKLTPDFKTIADFRKNNAGALSGVLRQFNQLCRKLELFGGQLLAIDGTKIKAVNATDENWSRKKLDKQAARLESRLQEYLQALDQADAQEGPLPASLNAAQLQQKIEQLKARQADVQQAITQMDEHKLTEISATDPDSRAMKRRGHYLIGYNVQAVADSKHHLIVTSEVSNCASDYGQLLPMAKAAKEQLQIQQADVVADGGYLKSQDIKDCQEIGMEPHLPSVENSSSERAGLYGKADFVYDATTDTYHCPAGAELKRRRSQTDKGRLVFSYDNPGACQKCPIKSRCTQSRYRTISRWEHEQSIQRMSRKVAAQPQKLAVRKTLIEHCWGTLHWLLPGGFLVKGFEKVRAEVSLAVLAYNFKRALAVLGIDKLLRAVGLCRPLPLKRLFLPIRLSATMQAV